jgi:5-methylcytosine-specific restriction endonuclease McrA
MATGACMQCNKKFSTQNDIANEQNNTKKSSESDKAAA